MEPLLFVLELSAKDFSIANKLENSVVWVDASIDVVPFFRWNSRAKVCSAGSIDVKAPPFPPCTWRSIKPGVKVAS